MRKLPIVLVASGDGEGERVDQQVGLRKTVSVAGEIDQPGGDTPVVIVECVVIGRIEIDKIGGFRPGYEGSQDYDLLLRTFAASKP